MIWLARPGTGRSIAGVCRAMAGAYGVPVLLVRAVFVVSFFITPVMLLIYLLLALSIPSERSVVSEMGLRQRETGPVTFAKVTNLLLDRTGTRSGIRSLRQLTVVPLLLLATLVFGLSNYRGAGLYQIQPLIDMMQNFLVGWSSPVLYTLIAVAFLLRRSNIISPIALQITPIDHLILEPDDTRSIGGLASGIARVTRLDVSWVRVFLLLINILTFGVIGGIYVMTVWLLRRMGRGETALVSSINVEESSDCDADLRFSLVASGLFFLLALIRLTTEIHLFYFNESVFRGIVLSLLGVLFARRRTDPWLIVGAAVMFLGVYSLGAVIFHVQPGIAGWWEVSFWIAALSITYYAVVALRSEAVWVAIGLAGTAVVAILLLHTQMISEPFLLALSQFYNFFYPLIFAGLGLWVIMEG